MKQFRHFLVLVAALVLAATSCQKAPKEIPVSSVSLNKTSQELVVGESVQLNATVNPSDATEKTITWSSSNQTVATVAGGKVTAVAEGIATITASAGGKSATCTITVNHKTPPDAIVFADARVKECLVAAFDTNWDGELTYTEAAAVTSGSALEAALREDFPSAEPFRISFDEFQYFTGITKVHEGMFASRPITSIVLPVSIEVIERNAFYECFYLTSITIPESVYYIGDAAFEWCVSLTSINIPEGIQSIHRRLFIYCGNLTSITIPKSVTSIGEQAFLNCSSLTSITIPDGVTSIGFNAFTGCSSLTSIKILDGVTSIESEAFRDCSSLTSITIPESVTSIGSGAFRDCSSLTSITIPESVTSIGSHAFWGCSSLTSITIPDGVTSILVYAFRDCSSLTSITIPESVTFMDEGAFGGCSSLTSIIIPDGVTIINDETFYGCSSLTSITIPENVISIGPEAFRDCSALQKAIVLPKAVPQCITTEYKPIWKAFDGSTCPIYVPSESVNAYKAADHWNKYADRIQAFPE